LAGETGLEPATNGFGVGYGRIFMSLKALRTYPASLAISE
jgi:hypothetical protein